MARHESPDSSLSDISSGEDFDDDTHHMEDQLPPAKRQKVGAGSTASSAVAAAEPEPEPDALDDGMSAVSSDTEGDIPSSPINARLEEDDYQEQITACVWDGCDAGELGTMDRLVEHIHNDHIEGKQKRYTCEWNGCNRKSMPHASGYALKAHMRSHTREKPFYCYLPECDRAFTRSDALAKHMRTVHETEALRPSDPVPKSMQGGPAKSTNRLKIIIKTPASHAMGQDDMDDDSTGAEDVPDFFTQLTPAQGFTPEELELPLEELHGHCRRELKYAEREQQELERECEYWDEMYKKEWAEVEVLLDQTMKSELDWHQRRATVLADRADVKIGPEGAVQMDIHGGEGEESRHDAAELSAVVTPAGAELGNLSEHVANN